MLDTLCTFLISNHVSVIRVYSNTAFVRVVKGLRMMSGFTKLRDARICWDTYNTTPRPLPRSEHRFWFKSIYFLSKSDHKLIFTACPFRIYVKRSLHTPHRFRFYRWSFESSNAWNNVLYNNKSFMFTIMLTAWNLDVQSAVHCILFYMYFLRVYDNYSPFV